MSFDQRIALFSAIVGFLTLVIGTGGLVTVIVQLREAARQREADSMIKLFDINRELLSLGFSNHGLFKVLEDQSGTDELSEKRYLQLWLNQVWMMHYFAQRAINHPELKESLDWNLTDLLAMKNMRHRWEQSGQAYPASFRCRVNEIIKKLEPSPVATPPTSGR
jgi:hypothetical protein